MTERERGLAVQLTPPSLAAHGTHRPNTQPRGLRWGIGWRPIRCGEVRDPSTPVDDPARRYPQTPIVTTRPLPDQHHSAPREALGSGNGKTLKPLGQRGGWTGSSGEFERGARAKRFKTKKYMSISTYTRSQVLEPKWPQPHSINNVTVKFVVLYMLRLCISFRGPSGSCT